MIGAYIRVSTTMQSDNDSIANQILRAEAFAEKMAMPFKIFKDVESGGKANRVQWTELKKEITGDKIQVVWANVNDRLGRNLREALAFWDLCQDKNIRLIVDAHEIDFDSDSDFLNYGFSSLISESARRKIIRNTKDAKAIVINDGRNTFRALYGYSCKITGAQKNNRPIREWYVNEDQAEAIRIAYDEFVNKQTPVYKIAVRLNDLGYRTLDGRYFACRQIYHILHHPEYAGITRDKSGGLIESKIYKTEIISKELFYKALELYPIQATGNATRRPPSHPASSLLKCGYCGNSYFFHPGTNYDQYYHPNTIRCEINQNKSLHYEVINEIFAYVYKQAMKKNPAEIYNTLIGDFGQNATGIMRHVEHLETEIAEAEKAIEQLFIAIEKKLNQELAISRINTNNDLIVDHKKEIKKLKSMLIENQDKIASIVSVFAVDKIEQYGLADGKKKRALFAEIMKSGIVKDGIIEIVLIDGRRFVIDYQKAKAAIRKNRKLEKVEKEKHTLLDFGEDVTKNELAQQMIKNEGWTIEQVEKELERQMIDYVTAAKHNLEQEIEKTMQ